MGGRGRYACVVAVTLLAAAAVAKAAAPPESSTAFVGATVIDGNGGPPLADATVVVTGTRIAAVGARGRVEVPQGARVVDAKGKFLLPGFIDTNVHLSLYGGATPERYETLVRYQPRQAEVVLEASQMQLKHGITTVRDSYGVLEPLLKVRDAIARGEAIGARMQVAGNIVGWGGPFSISFSLIPEKNLSPFQEQMNDAIAQGAGEELMDMSPPELARAIGTYLDKGPDFVKYGGTSHFSTPTFIGFSAEAQRALVDEVHRRGKIAETHSTTAEGLRVSVLAGTDLIQHPEHIDPRELPDELVALIRERDVICSMLTNTYTGEAWKTHLKKKEEAEKKRAESEKDRAKLPQRTKTTAERRRERDELNLDLEVARANAQKLIKGGCRVTIGTDNYRAAAPEFARTPKPEHQDHGIGSVLAIEGLVELGMTPAQAIVSATRNGARACKSADLGTIEAGKLADILLLEADPLADIRNIRTLHTVMKDGRVVELDKLPEKPIYYRPAAASGS
jgi:imidazolonepropionase-like amidohydrolase